MTNDEIAKHITISCTNKTIRSVWFEHPVDDFRQQPNGKQGRVPFGGSVILALFPLHGS